jgi:hypothetical protein
MTEENRPPSQSASTPASPRSPRPDSSQEGTTERTGRKRSASFYSKTNPYNTNQASSSLLSPPQIRTPQSQPQNQNETSPVPQKTNLPSNTPSLNLNISNRVQHRSLTREELESIIPKHTLKQTISIELNKIGPLQIPEKIQLEEAKEFEEKAEKYIVNHSTAELRDFRLLNNVNSFLFGLFNLPRYLFV